MVQKIFSDIDSCFKSNRRYLQCFKIKTIQFKNETKRDYQTQIIRTLFDNFNSFMNAMIDNVYSCLIEFNRQLWNEIKLHKTLKKLV